MKYTCPLLLLISLFLFPAIAQADILLQEDFSDGSLPTGWANNYQQGTARWLYQSSPTMGSPSGGGYTVFDDAALGAATTPNEATLTTRSVDCSGRPNVYVTYSHYWFGVEFTHGFIEVSTDGGATYSAAFDYHTITRGSLGAPKDTTINISTLAGNQSDVKVRLRYTDGGQTGQFWYVDDLIIHTGIDVAITNLVTPDYLDCNQNFGATEPVTLRIYNHGLEPISNIPLTCEVSGGTIASFSETYTGTIPPYTFADHTFTGTIDMSTETVYIFEAFTHLMSDEYNANDTLYTDRWPVVTKNTLPYIEDFEISRGGWEFQNQLGGAFHYGEVPYLNGPEGNGNSFYTEITTGGNNIESYLVSPVFDFSEVTEPILSLDLKYDLYGNSFSIRQYVYMSYTLDDGATWERLGDFETPNWYTTGRNYWQDTQATWLRLSKSLCELSGESCVKLRFNFSFRSATLDYEFAMDNLEITEGSKDDVHILQFYPPDSGDCTGFSNTQSLGITVRNNTCRALSKVPIQIDITGPASLSFIDSIGPIPALGYYHHPFTPTMDMSAPGTYNLQATLTDNLNGSGTDFYEDTATTNNTIRDTRINGAISTFPYKADYNTNNDGWSANSDNPIQLFVRDTLRTMGGMEGEGHCWLFERVPTNLGTNYYTWVESPVFDLSNTNDPNLYMDIKQDIDLNQNAGAVYTEYSIDGGISWLKLGTIDFPNWYNHPNYSGNYRDTDTSWHQVQFPICDLKMNCVKFRVIARNTGYYDSKFAFDNFEIIDAPDAGVVEYIDPVDRGCLFSKNQQVTVAVYNWSCNPMTNVPITFEVTGTANATLSGTVLGPIPAMDTVHYTFPGSYDMTPLGYYYLTAQVNGFDANLRNDTLKSTINVTRPKITDFPYTEDFEANDGFWIDTMETATTQFHWGPLPYLNGPEGNGNSWYIEITGNNQPEVWIESPVFDLSKISEPFLELDIKYDLQYSQNREYAQIEYSIDGGMIWDKLGTSADTSWYNSVYNNWNGVQATWKRVSKSLCDLSGEPCVQFRIIAKPYYSSNKYFAFDNLVVTAGTGGDDLQPVQLHIPDSGNCTNGFSNAETPTVRLRNNFCRPMTDVPISITMSGPINQILYDTLPGPVPRFGYYQYELSQTLDMSLPGEYTFDIEVFSDTTGQGTSCINDTFPANNILTENRYFSPINTVSYSSDFEANTGGWASTPSDGGYFFLRDTLRNMGGHEGFGRSWYVVDNREDPNIRNTYIESPNFDLTGFTNPQLLMDIKNFHPNRFNKSIRMQYSINDGAWNTLGLSSDPSWYYQTSGSWVGVDTAWHKVQYSLCDFTIASCIKFRIHAYNRYIEENNFAFDNFEIIDAPDVSPISLVDPFENGCLYSTNQGIKVAVYNWSCTDVVDIPVSCTVSGTATTTFSGTVLGPIPPGDSVHYSIPGSFDMTPIGMYYFSTTTSLGTDQVNYNDTYMDSIEVTLPKVTTFPYEVDFNNSTEQWISVDGETGREWLWDSIPYLEGADGFGKSWYTSPNTSSYTTFYLESPVFDLSTLTNPYMTFDLKYYLYTGFNSPVVNMQYSLDGGQNWLTLGENSDPKWYTGGNKWALNNMDVDTWTQMSQSLCQFAGESCLKLRFQTKLRSTAKVGFDNFKIREIEDVAPLEIISPVQEDCLYTGSDTVKVELYNWSCYTLFDVKVAYQVSGPISNTVTEMIDSIPAEGSMIYSFDAPLNLLPVGTYQLEIYTDQPAEVNRHNDTIRDEIIVDHVLINSFDHFEDFNSDSGYGNWTAYTTVSDGVFLWGTVPFLNGPEGNGNSWYATTNGTNSSLHYLESPVYDFSNTTNPELFLELKFDRPASGSSTAQIEYSLNGSSSWIRLGSNTDPNWYTTQYNHWGGAHPDWTVYHHNLCQFAGESCVKFRFSCRTIYNTYFFAIDNWHITDTPVDLTADLIYSCSGSEYELELTIQNRELPCIASPTITDYEVGYSIDGSAPVTTSYNGQNLLPGVPETLIIPNVTVPSTNSIVKVWINNLNPMGDQVFENDTLEVLADLWPDCNDHCSNAYQLAIGTTTTSQTSNATINPIEDPLFNNCGPITIENTVWYSFQTNASGGIVTAGFEGIVCSPSTNGIQVSIDALNGPACDVNSLTNVYCNSPGDTNPFQYGPTVLPGNTIYYIAVDGFAGNSCDFDIVLSGAIQGPGCIPVAVNAILEGPYDMTTGLMKDQLRVMGVIPTLEPFTGYGMTHVGFGGGEIVDPIIFDVTGPDAIIDWVFLELRDPADSSLVLATRSALLQADGDIVDLDGIFAVQFCGLPEGNYYVAIRPRHHLATMTAFAIPLIRTVINVYDFRTGNTYVDNMNSTPQKLMSDGNWALYEGDLSADFEINALDRSLAWNARNQTGYLQTDSNMDGVCDAADRSQVWNNRNKTAHIPRP